MFSFPLVTHFYIELQKIATWYRANKMSANASKTKYIIFHNKGKTVDTNGPGANP
jgi:hypothetical protein